MVSSACSMRSAWHQSESGRVLIDADEAGMRALSDWTTGMVTTGKASADVNDTPYHEMRREQEKGRTIRLQIRRGGEK